MVFQFVVAEPAPALRAAEVYPCLEWRRSPGGVVRQDEGEGAVHLAVGPLVVDPGVVHPVVAVGVDLGEPDQVEDLEVAAGLFHGAGADLVVPGCRVRVGKGDGRRDALPGTGGVVEADAVEVGDAFVTRRRRREGVEQGSPHGFRNR